MLATDLSASSGPLRLQLPFVYRGTRYRATDGQTPSWLALYDLKDVEILHDPSYLQLRESRSEKEDRLLNSIPARERKAGTLLSTKGSYSSDISILVWVEMSLMNLDDKKE